jgi:hypothetical protein
LAFKRRTEAEIPREVLDRIDTVNALRTDFQNIDSMRARWFQWRGLRWSLDAGEPSRVYLSLCGVCTLAALSGTRRAERQAQRLLQRISTMVDEVSASAAHYAVTRAVSFFMRRQLNEVLAPASDVERLCREGSVESEASYFLRFVAASLRIGTLYALGNYRAFATELDSVLSEARATENEAALLSLAWNEALKDEIEDHADESVERLMAQRGKLLKGGFGTHHSVHMIAVCVAASSSGRYTWGLELLSRDWERFRRSPVRHSVMLAMSADRERARLVINHRVATGAGSRALHEVRAQARRRSSNPVVAARRALVLARLAFIDGDTPTAIAFLRKAAADSPTDFLLQNSYALGHMIGGEEGATMCAEAERRMREQGVSNTRRFIRGYFPELLREG